jgi:hypothetical protein
MTRDTLSVRTDRKDEVRQQRRRRDDATIDGSQRKKLAIPAEVEAWAKAEGRTLRWASDEGNRIYQLTQMDDYDVVEGVAPIPSVIDKKSGAVANQVLLSKPTAFVEEDRQKREVPRREKEAALLRGRDPEDPIAAQSDFYAVEGNKISHGGPRSP